jgi:F-type H+-transporting ATPase subunit b
MRNFFQKQKSLRTALILAGLILCLGSGSSKAQMASPTGSSAARASDSQTASADLTEQSRKAGNEDEQAEFKHSSSVRLVARITGLGLDHAYWLCVLLNFAVVAGAIVWASKKHLPAMFRNRTASIQQAMAEARKTSEEADRRLADIESRLSRLGAEIEDMRAAAEKEAADEEERTKAAAIEDAKRIVESAEQEIAAAARTARRDLTAYAADLAVSLARKQIHVDAGTDQDLIRSFAKQLSEPSRGKTQGSS